MLCKTSVTTGAKSKSFSLLPKSRKTTLPALIRAKVSAEDNNQNIMSLCKLLQSVVGYIIRQCALYTQNP